VIEDADVFSYLRAFANFVTSAGYSGLVLVLDELTNLMRSLQHPIARQKNLDQLLQLYNDVASGWFGSMMVVVGSTPETIDDERRGLASYGAIRRRLLEVAESDDAPVLRLQPLNPSEVEQLAGRVLELWNCSAEPTCPATPAEVAHQVLNRNDLPATKVSALVAAILETIASYADPELGGVTPSVVDAMTMLEL
jgi:hypothetical protein